MNGSRTPSIQWLVPVLAGVALAVLSPRAEVRFGDLPVHSEAGHVQAVVEIPAGTNRKLEYKAETNSFPPDQKDGRDRVVAFLSYPGNYGFIPSTRMDFDRGGDGDALDVLVIGAAVPTGSVQEILPIGVLQLLDGGEIDDKLIAVLADPAQRTLDVEDVRALPEAAREILELWFGGYKGAGVMEFKGWLGADAAATEIARWTLRAPD